MRNDRNKYSKFFARILRQKFPVYLSNVSYQYYVLGLAIDDLGMTELREAFAF